MPQARPSKASQPRPIKKPPSQPAAKNAKDEPGRPNIDRGLQQKCLDIFRDALKPTEQSQAAVQEIKGHLFKRDFAAAFGREEYLQGYASRWSPSRALGYLQVLSDVQGDVLLDVHEQEGGGTFKVLCIGGGAGAEHVAFAGWMCLVRDHDPSFNIDAHLLDIASWSAVVEKLQKSIATPPELSKYAPAAAKVANTALLSGNALRVTFTQQDALECPSSAIAAAVEHVNLVTLMFTLNELYATSLPKTQALLNILTSSMPSGSSLLVVDSPGSYSTVSINGTKKKYPMQWLLDLTLLGPPGGRNRGGESGEGVWEKVVEDESRWFRLVDELTYPIELENMRYQIHLYRKV